MTHEETTARTISGLWSGRYWYQTTEVFLPDAVPFTAYIIEAGSSLVGRTLEPNTFVVEGEDELSADIIGTHDMGVVEFTKHYDPIADLEDFEIAYAGEVNDELSFITGDWVIDDGEEIVRGGFELSRTSNELLVRRANSAKAI